MTHLYLLRHGTAFPAPPGGSDASRALSPEGVKEIETVARGLHRLKVDPEWIFTSPLPRASRTAQIIAEGLGVSDRLKILDLLGTEGAPEEVSRWLESRREDRLILVGHNPGLSLLAGLLIDPRRTGSPIDLKKGGVVALRGESSGGFQLKWLTTPKMIGKLLD